jgi:high-affinity Fe2+/Pb2+ permease
MLLDIAQGSGLAAASGVRPFLPPVLAGALGRADLGVNFSGGDFAFLESLPFIAVLLVLAALSHAVRLPPPALAAAAVALGALLFAGSLTEGGREGWAGLPLGAACAALAWYASARFFERARARLDSQGGFLAAYGDLIALALAIVAVVLPPLSFAALGAFVLLLLRGRRQDERKYEGLRILR